MAQVIEMPYISIKIIKEYSTPEFKAKLIARLSEAAVDVVVEMAGGDKEKMLAHTWCIVEEVPLENWGINRVPLSEESLEKMVGSDE